MRWVFSVRALIWVGGLIGIVVAVLAPPWSEEWREIGPLAVVLGVALIGLFGELPALARSAHAKPVARHLRYPRPADGAVGIAPMAGMRSEPNPCDPRFRCFISRE